MEEQKKPFWREWEFGLAIGLVAAAFFARLGALPLHGEEPRWSQVGIEMAACGDWIVPRDQKLPFYSRPPLHSWMIAASHQVFGVKAPWVPRVPSALAVVLTAALIYGYGRQFIGRTGALAAALAYPFAGEILQQGAEAETEAVYILFLSASLLLWHWGYARGWRPWITWSVAYVCAALACLCKGGLQPPVYLLGPTVLILAWKRDWRYLLGRGHIIGLAAGLALVAAWVIPCVDRVGWESTRSIWFADTATRFRNWKLDEVLKHMAEFPLEVMGCLLPWGLLLLGYAIPSNRRVVFESPCVSFCMLAAGLAFLSCWIPPMGRSRYLCPLYPCLAVLVGVAVETVSEAASQRIRSGWKAFLTFDAIGLGVVAAGLPAAIWIFRGTRYEQITLAPSRAFLYGAALAAAAVMVWRSRRNFSPDGVRFAVLGVTVGTALFATGVMTDVRVNRMNDLAEVVLPLREKIGPDDTLVSCGPIAAVVPYYLDRVCAIATRADEVPPGGYFCFLTEGGKLKYPSFSWDFATEEVAVISVERTKAAFEPNRATTEAVMVIRRRLPNAEVKTSRQD